MDESAKHQGANVLKARNLLFGWWIGMAFVTLACSGLFYHLNINIEEDAVLVWKAIYFIGFMLLWFNALFAYKVPTTHIIVRTICLFIPIVNLWAFLGMWRLGKQKAQAVIMNNEVANSEDVAA